MGSPIEDVQAYLKRERERERESERARARARARERERETAGKHQGTPQWTAKIEICHALLPSCVLPGRSLGPFRVYRAACVQPGTTGTAMEGMKLSTCANTCRIIIFVDQRVMCVCVCAKPSPKCNTTNPSPKPLDNLGQHFPTVFSFAKFGPNEIQAGRF